MQTNWLLESLCIKAPHWALYHLWFQNTYELYIYKITFTFRLYFIIAAQIAKAAKYKCYSNGPVDNFGKLRSNHQKYNFS